MSEIKKLKIQNLNKAVGVVYPSWKRTPHNKWMCVGVEDTENFYKFTFENEGDASLFNKVLLWRNSNEEGEYPITMEWGGKTEESHLSYNVINSPTFLIQELVKFMGNVTITL